LTIGRFAHNTTIIRSGVTFKATFLFTLIPIIELKVDNKVFSDYVCAHTFNLFLCFANLSISASTDLSIFFSVKGRSGGLSFERILRARVIERWLILLFSLTLLVISNVIEDELWRNSWWM